MRAALEWVSSHRKRPIELAFLLWGQPPTEQRPAVVRDIQPMSSQSTAADVLVSPEAALAAWEELRRRNPEDGSAVGVSHGHPGRHNPVMSERDHGWHRDCLDLYGEMAVDLPRGDGDDEEGVPHQVFYQLIFPEHGSFESATAYLIARRLATPLAEQRHFEIEIRHEYLEAQVARSRLQSFAPSLGRNKLWMPVSVTFGGTPSEGTDPRPDPSPASER